MTEHDIGIFYLDKVGEYFDVYPPEYARKVADATYIALTLSIANESVDALERLRKLAAAYKEYQSKLEAGEYEL